MVEPRASDRPGGRAASVADPATGRAVDVAPHVLLGCCRALASFWGAAEVAWHDAYAYVEADGRRTSLGALGLPAPLHLAPLLPRLLSPSFRRHFIVSALNAEPAEVSARGLLRVLRGVLFPRDGWRMGIPRRPLGEIHAAVLARLRARGLRVVEEAATSVEATGVRLASGAAIEADAVLLAVPAWEAGRLLGGAAARLRLDLFRPAPIAAVHLRYDRRLTLPPFAGLLAGDVHWVFDRTENWGLEGGTYLSCVVSAAGPFLSSGRDEAIARAAEDVARAFPEVRAARLVASSLTAEARATFVPAPGLDAHRPGPAALGPRGPFLAGDWTDTGWPSTMEGAVLSGLAAAAAAETARR